MTFISDRDHLRSRPERSLHTYSIMVGRFVTILLDAFDRFAELAQLGYNRDLETPDRPTLEEDGVIQVRHVGVPPCGLVGEFVLQSIYNAYESLADTPDIVVFHRGKWLLPIANRERTGSG